MDNEQMDVAIRELVVANRILANEGVIDAYGHVSIRHPLDPGHYLLSWSRSASLVGPNEGKLRGIAISSAQRSPLAKDVPTVAESGYPDFEFDSYVVMLAPAPLPDTVASLLESEIRRAVTLPEFEKTYRARDVVPVGDTGAETKAWMVRETARWAKVVKAAHIHAD